VHGNSGRNPINTFSKQQVEAVKKFVENFGEAHGLPLPGRLPKTKRQWYLYEQIRPFCKTNLAADFTCPKPNIPKPSGSSEDTVTSQSRSGQNEQCTSKGTKRKCSSCKQVGHTKRTCRSKEAL
jgi:hypothetical protein